MQPQVFDPVEGLVAEGAPLQSAFVVPLDNRLEMFYDRGVDYDNVIV